MPQPAATHVPPQNIEAEESVLGAMLVAEPTLTRVIDEVKLNAEDFYLEKHATIFTCVHDLYAASKPVDELSVTEALVWQQDNFVNGHFNSFAISAAGFGVCMEHGLALHIEHRMIRKERQ